MAIKGAALDTRLQNKVLLDPKLQRRLTGDEFRSFINLLVWSVSLVTDGAFDAEDAEMIITDRAHIERFKEVGLVACDDEGRTCIHPDYWEWQTSKADLEKMAAKREGDKIRKRKERENETPAEFDAKAPY